MSKKTQKHVGLTVANKDKWVNNLPKETRWKKGCASPNPAGRPRIGVFSAAAKAILAEEDPKLRKTGAERLIEQAYRRALQGSYRHLELLLAYAEGRPKQAVGLEGSGLLETLVKVVHINSKEGGQVSNS